MNETRHYLGIDFEVWEAQQRWLWCVIDPHRDGGAIGAAATEAEAVRHACISIEEMAADCDRLGAVGWEVTLASFGRYLTCVRDATA